MKVSCWTCYLHVITLQVCWQPHLKYSLKEAVWPNTDFPLLSQRFVLVRQSNIKCVTNKLQLSMGFTFSLFGESWFSFVRNRQAHNHSWTLTFTCTLSILLTFCFTKTVMRECIDWATLTTGSSMTTWNNKTKERQQFIYRDKNNTVCSYSSECIHTPMVSCTNDTAEWHAIVT